MADAYYDGRIILDVDNSAIDVELENDTENYIEIFGKKDFEKMELLPKMVVVLFSFQKYEKIL